MKSIIMGIIKLKANIGTATGKHFFLRLLFESRAKLPFVVQLRRKVFAAVIKERVVGMGDKRSLQRCGVSTSIMDWGSGPEWQIFVWMSHPYRPSCCPSKY